MAQPQNQRLYVDSVQTIRTHTYAVLLYIPLNDLTIIAGYALTCRCGKTEVKPKTTVNVRVTGILGYDVIRSWVA